MHTPYTIKNENKLSPEVLDWFSFATEKCAEVATLASAVNSGTSPALEANAKSIKARRDYEKNSNSAVRDRVSGRKPEDSRRKSPFSVRKQAQEERLKLPLFPTTTIGSFPQTKEIRTQRARFNKKEITQEEYEKFIEKEIQHVVKLQEDLDLDVLVHGEPERNDMVQYFGEQLEGFAFTQNAWVQSFGSRYVRPPIIVGDVSRPHPMTIRWSKFAQAQTKRVMKGMLTGPCTIMAWSFPRADISREEQMYQLAFALRDEVTDLEKAGIVAIQVDEPAIREGLPLRHADWDTYLTAAVESYRIATSGVSDACSIQSHYCYSDFNDIIEHVWACDSDVISVENSKSDAKLLKVFVGSKATDAGCNFIGPGIFDIHSPRVPTAEEQYEKLSKIVEAIGKDKVWVNPDCGLKTRQESEVKQQLANLVAAAKRARKELA